MVISNNRIVKIRHYGILSNRNRNLKLKRCKILTGIILKKDEAYATKLNARELLLIIKSIDINICPCCKEGKMVTKETLLPKICSPPEVKIKTA